MSQNEEINEKSGAIVSLIPDDKEEDEEVNSPEEKNNEKVQEENKGEKHQEQEQEQDNKKEEDPELISEVIDERNWFGRTCGKMMPGSLRGSIFSLSILSLGIGTLAIPQKVGVMGLFFSPIFIILSGLANLWSLKVLGKISMKYNLKKYEQVIKHLFGKKISLFFGIIMIINQTGIIILYEVILYKILGGCINEIGKYGYINVEEFAEKSFWSKFWVRFSVLYGI
jgi:hypothetical protein